MDTYPQTISKENYPRDITNYAVTEGKYRMHFAYSTYEASARVLQLLFSQCSFKDIYEHIDIVMKT